MKKILLMLAGIVMLNSAMAQPYLRITNTSCDNVNVIIYANNDANTPDCNTIIDQTDPGTPINIPAGSGITYDMKFSYSGNPMAWLYGSGLNDPTPHIFKVDVMTACAPSISGVAGFEQVTVWNPKTCSGSGAPSGTYNFLNDPALYCTPACQCMYSTLPPGPCSTWIPVNVDFINNLGSSDWVINIY